MLYIRHNDQGMPVLQGDSDEETLAAFVKMKDVLGNAGIKTSEKKDATLSSEDHAAKSEIRARFNPNGKFPERAGRVLGEVNEFLLPMEIFALIEKEYIVEDPAYQNKDGEELSKRLATLRGALRGHWERPFVQLMDGRWGLIGWPLPEGCALAPPPKSVIDKANKPKRTYNRRSAP